MVDLSVIIINWNTRQLLLDCLRAIYSTVHKASFEIIVVDNGSSDGSVEAVAQEYPAVIVIANGHNEGFAKANNIAIKRMQGEYAVLLNSDTLPTEGSLDRMHAIMLAHPEAGMCGPQLLYGDGSKQTSVGTYPEILGELTNRSIARLFHSEKSPVRSEELTGSVPVDFIIGACMFVRRTAINAVGMLDEDYFFFYEEIDWCYRMNRAGWKVYNIPTIEIFHFGGQSTKNINLRARVESWRSRYLFFQKSRKLSFLAHTGTILLGFGQTLYHFLIYLLLNMLSIFLVKRLRSRWIMFGYVLAWHLRGMPLSMGLPRS
jgi:GT2 family glycosyltransferase